jgi:hypothetical protein
VGVLLLHQSATGGVVKRVDYDAALLQQTAGGSVVELLLNRVDLYADRTEQAIP